MLRFSRAISKNRQISIQFRNYLEWSTKANIMDSWTNHSLLKEWIHQQISHFQPSRVHLCDGSIQEHEEILQLLQLQGVLIKLNEKIRPNSYIARSDPRDVARSEERTFICSESQNDAGPTNNWKNPDIAEKEFESLSENGMKGRTMYVVPFCMGPVNSKHSMIGIQITDSPIVVAQLRIMTRIGISVIKRLSNEGDFIPCVHTVGKPLSRNDRDSTWPCNDTKLVAHFPEQQKVLSFGSGYGGNALLGKKCIGLRIASYAAKRGGWLAEHMLIISLTNPEGSKKYIAASFPSACGKTNMAMMKASLPGWKVRCLGDDIAWIHMAEDGRLRAINPETGFFGVAPGTCDKTNPNMMDCLRSDSIYVNTALTADKDVWWEGKTATRPSKLVTWLKKEWKKDDVAMDAAHANSRFCVPIRNCRVLDPAWDDPEGVPLDAIIFGGRRSETIPLVVESRDWSHGVFMGSLMASETTAAAVGRRGLLRIDPFAMRPFCGYNMADYFGHWLSLEKRSQKLPKIFSVNWFRKKNNQFLWPGFCENIRVLKWIFERCDGAQNFTENIIGKMPAKNSIDLKGLSVSDEAMKELLEVRKEELMSEFPRYREFYKSFGKKRIPEKLQQLLAALEAKVEQMQ